MEVKVGKTYKLIEKINSGAFGEVFRGKLFLNNQIIKFLEKL